MEEEGPCTGRAAGADSMLLAAVAVDFARQVEAGDFAAHLAECLVVSSVGNGHIAQSDPRGWNEVRGARAELIAANRGERSHEHTSVLAKCSVIARIATTCAGLGAKT
jgi:hypothetical protein